MKRQRSKRGRTVVPFPSADSDVASIRLGIRENWQQFTLLVVINAFVGGMVGLERTIVPLIGTQEFGIRSDVVVFSFIIAFGVVKALVNFASGWLADHYTRRVVLIGGWIDSARI